MLRKSIFLLGFCISLVICSPFWYYGTDARPEPISTFITSTYSLPPMDFQNRNAVPSLSRLCDEKPCIAIKVIHGVTTKLLCNNQVGCTTYTKDASIRTTPTPVTTIKSKITQLSLNLKESTSSKSTLVQLSEVTTFYIFVTETIEPKDSATLVSSILLPINSLYKAGVAKTLSTQNPGITSESLQSSTLIGTISTNSKLPSTKAINTESFLYYQYLTTHLASLKSIFKMSDTFTRDSAILPLTSPSTYILASTRHEITAMPVTTYSPIPPMDISLLISILTATLSSSTALLLDSKQTPNAASTALTIPTHTFSLLTDTTPVFSTVSMLGVAGISSIITDITLLESILAATSISTLSHSSMQTVVTLTASKSMAMLSQTTSAPLGRKKSITSTRTITRTASPPTITSGPKWTGKFL
ncbi:hypothetical protein C7212DRAFT_314108 [Tuber magnatum]|uniref:Uncharacterized protein n=1 Tax=Tuber magnatum TaxID=42249 RepID=A0A317STG7_9PEZI|nr:hypothetical protein C7212DRAFT_314108 [Tuber magnatum]